MYVQAYSGNDTVGTGEKNSPVATLSKAVEIVKNDTEHENAQIFVGDGEYFVSNSIATRNTTKDIVIQAQRGKTPTLIGGVSFKIGEAIEADSSAKARLSDSSAAEHLYVLDLTTKVALNNIPAVNLQGTYSVSWATESKTPTTEMFYGGNAMTVARYPNDKYMTVSSVVNEGAVPRNWEDNMIGTDEYVQEADRDKNDVMVLGYTDSRIDNWTNASQALMFGYWKHDWATQTVPVTAIDTSAKTITSKYPSYFGVEVGQRFYVYNLLEEIDMPGEYFIDRETGKMYFYMPTGATADDEIHMSLNSNQIIDVGYSSNITIDGLKFTATRKNAIQGNSSNNITVRNCEFSNTADAAVKLSGSNNIVENCYIHDVNGGIYLTGGDRNTLTSSNNIVRNNEITRFARINKVYTYAISIHGVGNTATNNKMYDSEHTAVSFAGNDNIVSYNEIYDVCQEVDDAAAIYVGRTWTHLGNKVLYNYIHDIQSNINPTYPVSGIFYDDNYYTGYAEGNIFENIVGDAIRFNQGRDHTVTNNIFVNCSRYGVTVSDASTSNNYATQINDAATYIGNLVWETTYPELFTKDEAGNTIVNSAIMYEPGTHIFTNNFASNCGNGLFNMGPKSAKSADTSGSIIVNNDVFGGNFTNNGEVAGQYVENFKAIPFERIGLQN